MSELLSNIQVTFKKDNWIEVRIIGPVIKENYAKIRPFLQQHFRFNFDKKCYEVYTENPLFVKWLFKELRKADFTPKQVGRFHSRNINQEKKEDIF